VSNIIIMAINHNYVQSLQYSTYMVYTAVYAGYYCTPALYYYNMLDNKKHHGTLPIIIYYYDIIHSAIIWARIKGVREHNILPATRHELRVPAES